jgi:hypothetical protein
MTDRTYTTQLQAGLGMIHETNILLELWQPGMDGPRLFDTALSSGRFPNVSARRLKNVVSECFATRYLVRNSIPARLLQAFNKSWPPRDLHQLMFLFTSRANVILGDFVREVYWGAYTSGHTELSTAAAREFVVQANASGKTSKQWAESTLRRVAAYLTGCCADFGLLDHSSARSRRILPCHVEGRVSATLAYDLHFSGVPDNALTAHEDWALFGLDRADVIAELRRLSLKGLLMIQSAADSIRISWPLKTIEEVTDVLAKE